MAIPGQALSYKSQLKIMELRQRAQDKMGVWHQKISWKVLESGVMPLALLEKKIDAWIGEIKWLQIIAIKKLSLQRKLCLDKRQDRTWVGILMPL
jgi:hypothetical protein